MMRVKADVVVATYSGTKTGFLFEDSNLTEARLFLENETVGSICTATVEKILPSLDAAFLMGPEGMPLFYRLKENQGYHIRLRKRKDTGGDGISVGDTLLVQIESEAQKKKQASATAHLSLAGDVVIVNRTGQIGISKKLKSPERQEELKKLIEEIPERNGYGVILRTAAGNAEDPYIREVTIKLLCKLDEMIRGSETTPEHKWVYRAAGTPEEYTEALVRQGLYDSITVHTDLPWDREAAEEETAGYQLHRIANGYGSPLVIFNIPVLLEKGLAKKVFLKSGGYLYVEPTEAMTVIDVNSGKNIREKGHEQGALDQNLEAAAEIARLLRLRNISGMIMIDFISMKKEESRNRLLAELRRLTKNDPCHTRVVDITRLGIVEMTREKKLPPLEEQLRLAEAAEMT